MCTINSGYLNGLERHVAELKGKPDQSDWLKMVKSAKKQLKKGNLPESSARNIRHIAMLTRYNAKIARRRAA